MSRPGPRAGASGRTPARALAGAAAGLAILFGLSIFVGIGPLTPASLLAGDPAAWQLLLVSRLPRTLALALAGLGLAVAGLLMQILTRNRFVEPSTAGTVEWATLGLLLVTVIAPDAPVLARMGAAMASALAGTALFLRILRGIPLRSTLTVPLVGLTVAGIVGAATTFLAYRFEMLQALGSWTAADFSVVLRGRYELLWLLAGAVLAAYAAAERFTVAGLGRDVAVSLGLDHRAVTTLGLSLVATVTAATVVTVGIIPFVGLVVPNAVGLALGDNLRRTLPVVALAGAGLVVGCDLVGRLLRYPFEVPVGTVMGVLGSGLFLAFLLRRRANLG